MSVLVDHIYACLGALKSKQQYCNLADGQEVSLLTIIICKTFGHNRINVLNIKLSLFFQILVNPKTAMFMTHNPGKGSVNKLTDDLRPLFRQVALMQPDLGLVLKSKCSQLGLKAPSVLALRLKLVAELARDQL